MKKNNEHIKIIRNSSESQTDYKISDSKDHIKALELSVRVLQNEVNSLKNQLVTKTKSKNKFSNETLPFNEIMQEFLEAESESKLIELLHHNVNKHIKILESCIFFFTKAGKLKAVNDSNTFTSLDQKIYNFEEQGIIDWIISKKNIDFIPDLESSTNKKKIQIIIYPVFVRNKIYALFTASTNIANTSLADSKLLIIKNLIEDAAVALENIKSNVELARMNSKIEQFSKQMIKSSLLSSIGEITASIGSDLASPLKIIEANLKLIENGIGDQNRRFEIIKEQITKIKNLTERLSDLSGVDYLAKKQEFINLTNVIENIISFSSNQMIRDGITIKFSNIQHKILCRGNESQLEQVLLSLIFNSRDAMPDGGIIEIDLYPDKNKWAVLTVQDIGIGIDQNELKNIFEPYYTTKEKKSKLGMGLFYTKQIILSHKGKINIESELGKGTTVKILLPLVKSK